MPRYLHVHVKGHPKGYYEEEAGWKIVRSEPQERVRFVAGSFTLEEIHELQQQSKQAGRKPLPIYFVPH